MHCKIETIPSLFDSVLTRKFHYHFNEDERKTVLEIIKAEHADLGKELMIEMTRYGSCVMRTDRVKADTKFERESKGQKEDFKQETAVATKRKKK